MNDKKELKGLGGWLILVGIGVVFGPIRMLVSIVPGYKSIFEDGAWEALTTEGSEMYNPYFSSLFIGETIVNVIIFILSLLLVVLYFSKHYLFPKIFITAAVITAIFIPLDAWLVSKAFSSQEIFDADTVKECVKSLIVVAIWVPYMLVSERVKLTFVENFSGDSNKPPVNNVPA